MRVPPAGVAASGAALVNFGGQLGGALAPVVMGVLAQQVGFSAAFGFLLFGAGLAIVAALWSPQTQADFAARLAPALVKAGVTRDLPAGAEVEFSEDLVHVHADGAHGDAEGAGDLAVGQAVGHEMAHLRSRGLSATGAAPDAAAAATRAGGQPLDGPPRLLEGVVQRKRLPGPARGLELRRSEARADGLEDALARPVYPARPGRRRPCSAPATGPRGAPARSARRAPRTRVATRWRGAALAPSSQSRQRR